MVNFCIYVKDQKEKAQHGCLVFSELEPNDLKAASGHSWKGTPCSNKLKAFPSFISDREKMSASEFNSIWRKRCQLVFGSVISVTAVRKLIIRGVSQLPKDVQVAVARSKGHSIAIAEKVYDISDPHQLVEKARMTLQTIATEKSSIEITTGHKPSSSNVAPGDVGCSSSDVAPVDEWCSSSDTEPIEADMQCSNVSVQAYFNSITDQDNVTIPAKFIRVVFLDDAEPKDVYRLGDLKTKDRKRLKCFEDVCMEEECKSKWSDNLFYPAKRDSLSWSPQKRCIVHSDTETMKEPPRKKRKKFGISMIV
ncbi:uncharacterized protein LOC144745765 [Ciona intestinalis]